MNNALAGAVIDAIPVPAILIDSSDRVVRANAAAERAFGEGLAGRLYVLALRQPDLRAAIESAQREGRPATTRHVQHAATQDTVQQVTVSPVTGDGFRGVLCVFEDRSEQERAGQMRRDFVANVSHELRTPLTALLGFIETLRGAARDDAAARDRFLGIMEREAERMNRLVRDLLHLSRVEAEERVRPTTPVDIVALVQSVLTALRPMAAARGVDLVTEGGEGLLPVPGDADQLTQVFHNLVENAVKYGGRDRPVTLRFGQEATPRGPAVRIDVIDRGEGIDPLHLPRLTERFYRVDSHRSREEGGTGLGLAIVKHIVNRHRGSLRIDSLPGKGSTFSVILPAATDRSGPG